MALKKIVVLGVGKVGSLVALLLKNNGFEVTAIDAVDRPKLGFKLVKGDVRNTKFLEEIFTSNDAAVSCLPYHFNKKVVKAAYKHGIHYFDLTEDVPSLKLIKQISNDSSGVMAPQCGLAPGFISIAAASLARQFEEIRSIEMRVGALPQHPKGDLGYAINWSPEGLVNQYLNDCDIIHNGDVKKVPAMQDLETIVVGGKTLEAFTTSGGIGSMCETFAGKVQEMNYKTMRYPGHMKLMRFYFHELLMENNRKIAGEILVKAKPPVNNDVVYVYAAVEGLKNKKLKNEIFRSEFVKAYYPQIILGQEWRAISWTTACSVVATIELVAKGILPDKGMLKQEDINLTDFLNTKYGSLYR